MKMYDVAYEGGQSRHGSESVDYMMVTSEEFISEYNDDLYCEIAIEDCEADVDFEVICDADDNRYEALKRMVIDKAIEKGVPVECLRFFKD